MIGLDIFYSMKINQDTNSFNNDNGVKLDLKLYPVKI